MMNLVFHAQMKHVEINFHFVHDMVRLGHLDVRFISSKDQLLDLLTKPLAKHQFRQLCSKLPLKVNSGINLREAVSNNRIQS